MSDLNGDHRSESVDLAALADEHAYITSVDVCCFCGDSECDGIGCIASIDPNEAGAGDDWQYERMERLHRLLRQGQAWDAMQALRLAGADPLDALVVAASSLASASNQAPWPPCMERSCWVMAYQLLLGPLRPNASICEHGHPFRLDAMVPPWPEQVFHFGGRDADGAAG